MQIFFCFFYSMFLMLLLFDRKGMLRGGGGVTDSLDGILAR